MSLFPASGGKETYKVVQKNYTGTFNNVNAGAEVTYTIDVTESGYRPIGILGYGYYETNANGKSFMLTSMYIVNLTTGNIIMTNKSSSATKPYMVYMTVCYVKE